MSLSFRILWTSPSPVTRQRATHHETAHFRLCVRTDQSMEPHEFVVRLWTNIYHKENNEGEWHVVPMLYQDVSIKSDHDTVEHLYGVDLIMTCIGNYGFNYRVLCKRNKQSHRSQTSGTIDVNQAGTVSPLTEWIQYPMEAQITANIWMGNHAAALDAPLNDYDCLINTADDAPVYVMQLNRPTVMRKFLAAEGNNNVISDKKIHTAVRWLWEASIRCDKILVFSKYGCSRAASFLIAYIYARNPDLTFEEAFNYVDSRCPSYFHKGLKETLSRLYPRG